MIGTGKYDFPGIRKAGTAGIKALLALTSWGVWLVTGPFKLAVDFVLNWASEFLANHGLVVINVGAFIIDGKFDQQKFDKAMDEGLAKVKVGGLSDAEKAKIDNEVIKAFRAFARINKYD